MSEPISKPMSEPIPASPRTPLHRRNIDVQGYLREDGLWEIEGVLEDTKGYDIELFDRGRIEVGGFLHRMRLTLIINDQLQILDARAIMYHTPYQDCPGAAQQYQALVGLQIGKGWLADARKAVGRLSGCTHLTEMLPVLSTAAMQTIRGYHLSHTAGYSNGSEERKAVLNTCYGFRPGGRAQIHLWPEE